MLWKPSREVKIILSNKPKTITLVMIPDKCTNSKASTEATAGIADF